MKSVLDEIGIDGNRVNLYECGAAEYNRFLESIEHTMEVLEKIGPNPVKV